jgi:hypothetical protein
MDTIGASMSQQLFALTGTTEPRAQDALDSATANEIGRDGNGGRRTDSTCSWPSVVGTGGLTLKETTDLLLGFTLMGMHQEGLCGRRVMRALMSIALQICDNVKSFIEYCVPTKTIVQLLWAMSVADSLCTPEVHETQGKGASFIADSSGAAAAAEQMLEHVTRLGSRLLVIIVRRWWGGTLSLSASAVSRSSAAATPEVLDDVDAEMLLQVPSSLCPCFSMLNPANRQSGIGRTHDACTCTTLLNRLSADCAGVSDGGLQQRRSRGARTGQGAEAAGPRT